MQAKQPNGTQAKPNGTPRVLSGQRRHNASLAALASALLSLALLLAVATTAADARILDSYCSPTGDYCHSVNKSAQGRFTLNFTSFSFGGRYTVCVRHVRSGERDCRAFTLRESGGAFNSRVDFFRAFAPQRQGRYCATWHKFGGKLGPANCFGYDGPLA